MNEVVINKALPTIAVCLAAFNGVRFLPTQLDSILNQVDVSVTIYISVDLSIDGTEEWFNERAAADSRINLLPHGEHFGGAARNFFRLIRDVDFTKFDYLSFADQDDIWLPEKLIRAHKVLISSGAAGYSSNVTAFWTDGRQILINKSQPQKKWDFLFEAAGPGCTYLMNKSLTLAIQNLVRSRWDEIQSVGLHDWFVYAFARANSYRWFIDDVPRMHYRQHENNQVGVNAGWRAFIYRADKVLSGWGLAQSALIAQLVGLKVDPFVVSWAQGSRLGVLILAFHANQCRRRTREKFIFALACIALSIKWGRR